ncbi:7-cyano-7-deazaguanine synthase [Streptomyces sp. NPDC008196]|uniref:7-cyano-7-deazaguanine synthase n=1 Tax=Streptomyces sp. NPDC008196 TaxID=3364819 RepID=UPI0036E5E4EF
MSEARPCLGRPLSPMAPARTGALVVWRSDGSRFFHITRGEYILPVSTRLKPWHYLYMARVAGTPEATVLLSGGIDSAAVLALLKKQGMQVRCLFVDYGQLAVEQETVASRSIASHFSSRWSSISVSGLKVPAMQEVKGRNDLLIAVATVCNTDSIVALGTHGGTPYVDCSTAHHSAWQGLYDIQYHGVQRILAPFIDKAKPEVFAAALELSVPISLTYSCEASDGPCGKCSSCRDRSALR